MFHSTLACLPLWSRDSELADAPSGKKQLKIEKSKEYINESKFVQPSEISISGHLHVSLNAHRASLLNGPAANCKDEYLPSD